MKNTGLKPLTVGGELMEGYFINCVEGIPTIFSTKKGSLKPMSMLKSGKAKYPNMTFMVDGVKIRADVHRVVAENLLPFPRPESITKKDWDSTPTYVKEYIMSLSTVNHIDHNKYNWNIDNLEWTTAKGNARAYQNFRRDNEV
jgi:hypothetical protein